MGHKQEMLEALEEERILQEQLEKKAAERKRRQEELLRQAGVETLEDLERTAFSTADDADTDRKRTRRRERRSSSSRSPASPRSRASGSLLEESDVSVRKLEASLQRSSRAEAVQPARTRQKKESIQAAQDLLAKQKKTPPKLLA